MTDKERHDERVRLDRLSFNAATTVCAWGVLMIILATVALTLNYLAHRWWPEYFEWAWREFPRHLEMWGPIYVLCMFILYRRKSK